MAFALCKLLQLSLQSLVQTGQDLTLRLAIGDYAYSFRLCEKSKPARKLQTGFEFDIGTRGDADMIRVRSGQSS